MIFTIFTATCGDDTIAHEATFSFSTKSYFGSHPRDVDCWWNIKSPSADKLVYFWTNRPENIQVTIASPVCFYFSFSFHFSKFIFFLFVSFFGNVKNRKITKSNKIKSKFDVSVNL